MSYLIMLVDDGKYELATREADTLKEAKKIAKYLLSDEYANRCESSHVDMRTLKVEINNDKGECVWDEFRKYVK